MNRLREMLTGRNVEGRIVFTGAYNRLTSMDVRARQIADPLGAVYIRGRYLDPIRARRARCVIWVAVADADRVAAIQGTAPQVLDVINPSVEKGEPYFDLVDRFDALILNTESTLRYLRPKRQGSWRTAVIPHHHCNKMRTILPEERLERPKIVGYVGEPGHLHDADAIADAVRKMGLEFLMADSKDLAAYRRIDLGVAWTRPEALRDDTRSNIKLTNFCAYGIPSVVSRYESYQAVDDALGGGACRFASSLTELIEQLGDLASDGAARRDIHERARPAADLYSVESIAEQYRRLVNELDPS